MVGLKCLVEAFEVMLLLKLLKEEKKISINSQQTTILSIAFFSNKGSGSVLQKLLMQMIDWLILKVWQSVRGYFMPRNCIYI